MFTLPLRSLRDEDKEAGPELIKLAHLKQLGFPVADGLVIFPSADLKKEELKRLLGKAIDEQTLLTQPALVIFTKGVIASGKAYRMKQSFFPAEIKNNLPGSLADDTVIKIDRGILSPSALKKLDLMVKKMDRVLGISCVFHFIVDKGEEEAKIIRISPYLEDIEIKAKAGSNDLSSLDPIRPKIPSLKLFVDFNGDTQDKGFDGCIFRAESINNIEEKKRILSELARNYFPKLVIFKVSKKQLVEDLDSFLFVRNKQRMQNLNIAIPFVRSCSEFSKMKLEIASFGIHRKATQKIWLELAVPENLVHLDEYLNIGFDGALLNLDDLFAFYHGLTGLDEKSSFFDTGEKLFKFLAPALKTLSRERIPVIAIGDLCLKDEFLKNFIIQGFLGLALNINQSSGDFYTHLWSLEKYFSKKLLT